MDALRDPRAAFFPYLTPNSQVARALHYMHSKKIVHRDVKPENVMIIDRPAEDGLYPEVSSRLLARKSRTRSPTIRLSSKSLPSSVVPT